jgi:hypothetical protein
MMPKSRLVPTELEVELRSAILGVEEWPDDGLSDDLESDTTLWAQDGAAGAETVVVGSRYPVGVGWMAWADAADVDTVPVEHQSWGQAWSAAAVFLLIGVAVAFVIGAVGWVEFRHGDAPAAAAPSVMPAAALPPISTEPPKTSDPDVVAPTTTVTQPPTTVTVQAEPPPVTVQAQPPAPSRDDEFLERLQADQLVIHDRTKALAAAHWVCRQLAAGHSQAEVVASAEVDNPTVTHLGMVDYVAASALFYCPQYSGS